MKITTAIARRLPETPPVVELDVTSDDDLAALADRVREHVPHLDGVVHSIGFAPQGAFNFMEAGWDDVSTAVQVSAYSLASLTKAALPLMGRGRQRRRASPSTPASRGRSTTGWAWRRPRSSRPTATSPATSGRRASACNIVAAGPIRTTAAKSIPGFERVRGGVGQPFTAGLGRQRRRAGRARLSSPCCPTGSPPRPARWCTSTAASTRWASEPSSGDGLGDPAALGSPGEQRARGHPRDGDPTRRRHRARCACSRDRTSTSPARPSR